MAKHKVPTSKIKRVERYHSGSSEWNVMFFAHTFEDHPKEILVHSLDESAALLLATAALSKEASAQVVILTSDSFDTSDSAFDATEYKGIAAFYPHGGA